MASNEGDEVLQITDPNDSDFSGFDPVEIPLENVPVQKEKKGKKPKTTKNSTSSTAKSGSKTKNSQKASTSSTALSGNKNEKLFDLDSLTDYDIEKLRELLGFPEPYCEEENINYLFGDSLENLPNLHIELSPDSDEEQKSKSQKQGTKQPLQPAALTENLINAMFDNPSEQTEKSDCNDSISELWDLPKLKVPEKGPAVSQSLANLINTACTSQCLTDTIQGKYKIPENCDKLISPMVNNEIWKILPKRAQTYDKSFSDIQNLVAAGMVPIMKLADILKPQIAANQEAKTLFSDVITLMGQVQYHLSLRRRYLIRPQLKKKYQSLCNINMPITTKLFGDDVQKDVKNCDSGVSIAKENYSGFNRFRPYKGRGGFRGGYVRGQRGNYAGRYHPYYANNYMYGNFHQQQYGSSNYRGGMPTRMYGPARGRKQTVSATVTSAAPNETN